jgi:hypothetical protein
MYRIQSAQRDREEKERRRASKMAALASNNSAQACANDGLSKAELGMCSHCCLSLRCYASNERVRV